MSNSIVSALLRSQQTSMRRYASRLAALAARQTPKAMFVTCSDSRVVPNILMAADPGELFVVRNVGNLMPPADSDGRSTGDVSEASAVAYGVDNLHVGELVVCGHSNCGAMQATLAPNAPADPNLSRWLRLAEPARARLMDGETRDPSLPLHDQLSQLNVLQQVENLLTYPLVQARVERGDLRLHALWFDIANARVLVYSPEEGRFAHVAEESLDEAPAA